MKNRIPFSNHSLKLKIIGIFSLLILAAILYSKSLEKSESTDDVLSFSTEITNETSGTLQPFNPNELDLIGWQELGFSKKQAASILKYKNLVGGTFSSKNQIKKCFVISEDQFLKLESYILLPDETEENNYYSKKNNSNFSTKKRSLKINHSFNPDVYSVSDWMKIGFSEKQASTLLKYKKLLGGSFKSKEDFKKCFIINNELYYQMENYILLPEKSNSKNNSNKLSLSSDESSIKISPFNPNDYKLEDWTKLGFTEKQAHVILNYKTKILKGNFKTIEDVKNCFVISDEKFAQIKPYIILPQNIHNPINSPQQKEIDFTKIELNTISQQELEAFGFSKKIAESFIGFRNKLGGFVNKNQIYEVYNIDRELSEKLVNTTILDPKLAKTHTIFDAPESWLKTHPYIRYYEDKILYYRISYTNEKKIWNLMNPKPEHEIKMKMYLKN